MATTSYDALNQLADSIESQLTNDLIPADGDLTILYLNCLNLMKLNKSCAIIGKELISKKLQGETNAVIHQRIELNLQNIITSINYELYQNEKLLRDEQELLEKTNLGSTTTTTTTTTALQDESQIASQESNIAQQEDISELRKRLFSSSMTQESVEESNEHHENLQQEVLNDISNVVQHIKNRALEFQRALELDKDQVSKLEQNISNTQALFSLNLVNLSQFHRSGKLSYWELAKILILFTALIVVTMFIISIF